MEYGNIFWVDSPMVFRHNINGLFMEMKQEHNTSDRQLFIDLSQ
jgi:hypothetical protein